MKRVASSTNRSSQMITRSRMITRMYWCNSPYHCPRQHSIFIAGTYNQPIVLKGPLWTNNHPIRLRASMPEFLDQLVTAMDELHLQEHVRLYRRHTITCTLFLSTLELRIWPQHEDSSKDGELWKASRSHGQSFRRIPPFCHDVDSAQSRQKPRPPSGSDIRC